MFAFRPTSRRLAARLARPVQPAATSQQNARAYAAVETEQPAAWTRSTFPVPPPAIKPDATTSRGALDGKQLLREAVAADTVRNDWTREEIAAIYHQPLMELVHQAVRQAARLFLTP